MEIFDSQCKADKGSGFFSASLETFHFVIRRYRVIAALADISKK